MPNAEVVLGEALYDAAFSGDARSVTAWLDEGGGVDARCTERNGATLLLAAALAGHEAMVRMLLQRGASVNLQTSGGGTALMGGGAGGRTRHSHTRRVHSADITS